MTAVLGASEGDNVAYLVRRAVCRSRLLVAEAQRLQAAAQELRRLSRLRREGRHPHTGGGVSFSFLGVVDGREVRADWTPLGIRGSAALLTRADLVVRLGDAFDGPDGTSVPASLDGTAAQALLTLLRASDEVRDVSVTLPPRDLAGEDRWDGPAWGQAPHRHSDLPRGH